MKRSELKLIVTEIIRRTFWEMSKTTSSGASWSVSGDTVTLEDIELPDGRTIGAEVEVSGIWIDGAFSYEYGSIRGVHRDSLQFEMENWNITSAWEMESGNPLPLTPDIVKIINTEMDSVADKLPEYMEPPDPEAERADYEYERQRDREADYD